MSTESTPDPTDLPEAAGSAGGAGDVIREGTAAEDPQRERTGMDAELETPEDPLLRREERAAAAEAGRIGGAGPDNAGDEASRPVEEGGGGVSEGFEESERELIEEASHGEERRSPEVDAFTPEEESDRATSVYGEADETDPIEVVSDPLEEGDDPGEGPDLAPDR